MKYIQNAQKGKYHIGHVFKNPGAGAQRKKKEIPDQHGNTGLRQPAVYPKPRKGGAQHKEDQ